MSDLNQANDNLNTEANAEAAPAKGPAVPTTAKHARFLADAARKRSEKYFALVAEADKMAAHYDELATTLPESAPASAKAAKVYAVGEVVDFRYGRTTATSQAKVLNGTIKAVKETDGKVEAYRIASGEGFDETLYTVQPGQIVSAEVPATEEAFQTQE